MSNIVLDAIGIPASMGDKVVFAPAQRGAQEFIVGEVIEIKPATVVIEHGGLKWDFSIEKYIWAEKMFESVRKNGCFVIIKEDK